MPYYPKSQIKTGLYTNGKEYVLSTTKEEYVGEYYELSNGKKYTSSNILLELLDIPINTNSIDPQNPPLSVFTEYNPRYSSTNSTQNKYLPQFNTPLPTEDDYTNGNFTRYFCKKTNEPKILEITQTTYNRLVGKSEDILWSLYEPFKIPWSITQDISLNSQTNRQNVQKIINERGLEGFEETFQITYTQYSPTSPPQEDDSSSTFISSPNTNTIDTNRGAGSLDSSPSGYY